MIENFRIRVFRAVARHLNFSRAAEELFLTQPAVTQQIKALENELRVPLFDRTGGHISLTPAGKSLLPIAEKMKILSDEAIAAVARANGKIAGELTLGASQTIGQHLLPKFVAGFLHENPRVRIIARSGRGDAILEALVARDIELALIEGPDERNDIHVEPFMEDHMALVVPLNHHWANQEIEPCDLKSHALLMREVGSGSRRVIEHALGSIGIKLKDLNIVMELDSTEGLLSAVEAGLGVAFVSRWAVRNQLALGTLVLARVRDLQLSRKFSMAYRLGPEPTGNAGAFREFLLNNARELMFRKAHKA